MFSDSLHISTDFGFDIDIFDFIKHFLLVCQSSASESMMNTFIKRDILIYILRLKKQQKQSNMWYSKHLSKSRTMEAKINPYHYQVLTFF